MICLDSSVLILAQQGETQGHPTPLASRAARYLRSLDAAGTRVMIPTPVVAEYLVGIPLSDQAKTLHRFQASFIVQPFDLAAAARTGALMGNRWHATRERSQQSRQELKVDFMIAGIALTNHATAIVTENPTDFRRVCEGLIEVMAIPSVAEQGDLGLEE